MGVVMIENKPKTSSSCAQTNRLASRRIRHQQVGDREFLEQLERLAPWLKFIRLLRGPWYWISIAAISVSVFAVMLLSLLGWVPGRLGRILMDVGMVFSWAAMMIASAGWGPRSED
jgi:ABC-type phosphate transport system auxiliary subunit